MDGTRAVVCASVHPWVRPLTLLNINISETSRSIKIKFHLKHHWDREMGACGFGLDQTSSLVSGQQIAPIGL